MKPRQTTKNYQNSHVPPYQQVNQSQSTPLPPALRDIDLAKLGLNLDEMPNLQAPSSSSSTTNHHLLTNAQDEAVKCLQAIYGKNSADILQNLSTLNDWPMQSVSPSDYLRVTNNSAGAVAGGSNSNNNNSGVNGGNGGKVTSGTAGFNPITNNNTHGISGSSGQNKQELHQFINSQQQHPASASSQISQHFRISASNSMQHSPQHQQQLTPQPTPPLLQQQQQQQKSVLSLHHQHMNHQNEFSSRRLNHHQHHHHQNDPHANSSLANLNTVNAMPNSSTADSNHVSTLISGGGGGTNTSKNSHVSNLMDTLGGMEHLIFDNPLIINKDSTSTNQQSLLRHQHLQKLLKATGSQQKASNSASLASYRNDTQSQRNIATTSNMLPHQMSSSTPTSTISPPQAAAFSSVPKSLLNLAACSSTSGPSTSSSSSLGSTSKFSSMVNQLNMISGRNSVGNLNSVKSSTRGTGVGNISTSNNGVSNSHDSLKANMWSSNCNEMVLPRSSSASNHSGQNNGSKSNLKQQLQLSLLSDDQSSINRGNPRSNYNTGLGCNTKLPPTTAHIQKNNPSPSNSSSTSKEAFLANLQERAARAGVSIGEINNKPVLTSSTNLVGSNNANQISTTSQVLEPQQNTTTVNISSNQTKDNFNMNTVDPKEIESAISRVEARNDLSLLYPPMLLASNSQKQLNALSAGLHEAENSDLFTKEVKKIVLEECNIIYECKECNNLFRSLANLVKHKRTYCLEQNSERNSLEMNKRPSANAILPVDQRSSITLTNVNSTNLQTGGGGDPSQDEMQQLNNVESDQPNVATVINGSKRLDELAIGPISVNSDHNNSVVRPLDRRNNLSNMMIRMIQNQERKNRQREITNNLQQKVNGPKTLTGQSNLSELLQGQPKHRLPVSRDSALYGALSMTPVPTNDNSNPFSALTSDKNIISCMSNDVQEQLVRNSSLAKTLLSEKVRIANPRQSLIELSKVETLQQKTTNNNNSTSVKRPGPKRKFLEDCIQKVKRDKLQTEDEEERQLDQDGVLTKPTTKDQVKTREVDQDASLLDDSDVDSDMLMIDLDEPSKRSPIKRGKRRMSTAASSTTSSSASSNKGLNTSSALLKALTRPVDPKRTYTSTSSLSLLADEKSNSQSIGESIVEQAQEEKQPKAEVISEPEKVEVIFEKQTCDICEVDYKDLNTLMDHITDKHVDEKMVYPCIFCSLSFIALENVCHHILDIHQKPMAQVQRLKEVVRSRSYLSSDFLCCSDYPTNLTAPSKKSPAITTATSVITSITTNSATTSTASVATPTDHHEESVPADKDVLADGKEEEVEQSPSIDIEQESSQSSLPSRRNTEDQAYLSEETNPDGEDLEKASSTGDDESAGTDEEVSAEEVGDEEEEDDNGDDDDDEEDDDDDDDSDDDNDEDDDEEEANADDGDVEDAAEIKVGAGASASAAVASEPTEVEADEEPNGDDNAAEAEEVSDLKLSPVAKGTNSGGIMKLKIQLKTRPDDKGKVYEIV